MVVSGCTEQTMKYLSLLSQQFPNQQAVFTEIINLQAILNLPKGTEHFMSDVHGEYEAFMHILNNCSGVVREHVDLIFEDMGAQERADLCTLIYYPHEKIELVRHGKVRRAKLYYPRGRVGKAAKIKEALQSKCEKGAVQNRSFFRS